MEGHQKTSGSWTRKSKNPVSLTDIIDLYYLCVMCKHRSLHNWQAMKYGYHFCLVHWARSKNSHHETIWSSIFSSVSVSNRWVLVPHIFIHMCNPYKWPLLAIEWSSLNYKAPGMAWQNMNWNIDTGFVPVLSRPIAETVCDDTRWPRQSIDDFDTCLYPVIWI